VQQTWHDLPTHYHGIDLDAFIVMPNHVHGLIILADIRTAPRHPGNRARLQDVLGPTRQWKCRQAWRPVAAWLLRARRS